MKNIFKKSPKVSLTEPELKQQYTQLCAQLGEIDFNMKGLEEAKSDLRKKIKDLADQYRTLQSQKPAEQKDAQVVQKA